METLMIGFTHARRALICSTLIAVAACTAKTENQTDTASVTGDTGMASSTTTTTTTTPTPAASGTTASTTGAIVPININTATDAEILAIPGMGPRMLREFKEYRPYTSIEQFRREIGKYVDKAEVARLEKYIVIK
jgi:DNA uptake protein ComE-like DNA-binding protein